MLPILWFSTRNVIRIQQNQDDRIKHGPGRIRAQRPYTSGMQCKFIWHRFCLVTYHHWGRETHSVHIPHFQHSWIQLFPTRQGSPRKCMISEKVFPTIWITTNSHLLYTTSHSNSSYIQRRAFQTMSAARLQRYAVFLTGFDYNIEFRSCKSNANADVLSYLPLPESISDNWTRWYTFLQWISGTMSNLGSHNCQDIKNWSNPIQCNLFCPKRLVRIQCARKNFIPFTRNYMDFLYATAVCCREQG